MSRSTLLLNIIYYRYICLCRSNSPLHLKMTRFLVVLMMEGLHTLGITMLCFMVLPHLDSVDALLLTSSLAFVPALFLFLSRFQVNSIKSFQTFRQYKIGHSSRS